MEWIFEAKAPSEKARNPMGEDFFADSQLLTDVSALVREAVQNSLDAKDENSEFVTVKFRVGEVHAQESKPWFESALHHLNAGLPNFDPALLDSTCRYLAIEDFGTTGLLGDPEIDESLVRELPSSENSYHYFVHIEGDSNKGDGKQGKWGVGKVVFQKISRIKSLFILTERNGFPEKPRLALGQSILTYHTVDDVRFRPDGWLAQKAATGQFSPVPEPIFEAIRDTWELSRNEGEPGLSIVCPYVSEDVSPKSLLSAVISQYFVPIVMGSLKVEVSGGEGETVIVESSTISELAAEADPNLRDVVSALVSYRDSEIQLLKADIPKSAASIAEMEMPDTQLEAARNELIRGTPVAVEVTLSAPLPQKAGSSTSKVTAICWPSDVTSKALFSREGIIVPQNRAVLVNRLNCLVLVASGPVANLLARAEGPAHENWSDGTRKFQQAFGTKSAAKKVITLVRAIPQELGRRIHASTGQLDATTLGSFFSRSAIQGPKNREGRDGSVLKGGASSGRVLPTEQPQTQTFVVSGEAAGGLRIALSQAAKENSRFPKGAEISFAYKVARGNSFRSWSSSDFTLEDSSFSVSLSGATQESIKGNKLRVSDISADFSLLVSGFDTTLRDVEVDIERFLS